MAQIDRSGGIIRLWSFVQPGRNRGIVFLPHLAGIDLVARANYAHIENLACALDVSVDTLYEWAIANAESRHDTEESLRAEMQWQRYHFLCRQSANQRSIA